MRQDIDHEDRFNNPTEKKHPAYEGEEEDLVANSIGRYFGRVVTALVIFITAVIGGAWLILKLCTQ